MADDLEIRIGGDISPLEDALSSIPAAASRAGDAVNAALAHTSGVDQLTTSAQEAGAALSGPLAQGAQSAGAAIAGMSAPEQQAAAATQTLSGDMSALNEILARIQGGIQESSAMLERLSASEQQAAAATQEVATGVGQITSAIETMTEVAQAFVALAFVEQLGALATEAIHAYGEQERLATSLTLMGGSAEAAAYQMKVIDEMSVQLGLDQSTLEQTARKLAAAFGVGDGLTAVLQASANASAATGQSFEAVASSLERVQLTGQVSGRQLVALGLSWADLAKTMGVSIEQAQALLKKGGQDAAADVQVLLDAIKGKFGEAAAEQAKGVLGAFQSLKSALESLMEDIGGAIAPAIKDIANYFRETIVPAVRLALDAFNALPGPLKDFIVLIGAAGVALVPIGAALAALGFAIQGVEVILAKFGATSAATATEVQSLAVAETEAAAGATALAATSAGAAAGVSNIGAAATTAQVAAGGLGAAWTGIQWALVAGLIVETVKSLFDLAAAIKGAMDAWVGVQQAIDSGQKSWDKIAQTLEGIATTNSDVRKGLDDLWESYKAGTITLDELHAGLLKLLQAWNQTHAAQIQAKADADEWGAAVAKATNDIVVKQQDAQKAFDLAAASLAQMKARYAEHLVTIDAVTRAQAAYNSALDALHPKIPGAIESLGQLQAANQKAAVQFKQAAEVYQQALDAFSKGKATQLDVQKAWDQFAAAAQKAGENITKAKDALVDFANQGATAAAKIKTVSGSFTTSFQDVTDSAGTATSSIRTISIASNESAASAEVGADGYTKFAGGIKLAGEYADRYAQSIRTAGDAAETAGGQAASAAQALSSGGGGGGRGSRGGAGNITIQAPSGYHFVETINGVSAAFISAVHDLAYSFVMGNAVQQFIPVPDNPQSTITAPPSGYHYGAHGNLLPLLPGESLDPTDPTYRRVIKAADAAAAATEALKPVIDTVTTAATATTDALSSVTTAAGDTASALTETNQAFGLVAPVTTALAGSVQQVTAAMPAMTAAVVDMTSASQAATDAIMASSNAWNEAYNNFIAPLTQAIAAAAKVTLGSGSALPLKSMATFAVGGATVASASPSTAAAGALVQQPTITVSVPTTVNGPIVGSNGITQFSQMVGQSIVDQLKRAVGLKISY